MLKLVAKVLAAVGKPFYFIISRLFLAILFIPYLIGHAVRISLKLFSLRASLFELKIIAKIKKKTKKTRRSKFRIIIKPVLAGILAFLILISILFYFVILRGLPSPQNLTTRQIEVSTKIYDRKGNLLYKIYKDKNRTVISLDQIPPHVRLATLAAEDAEFYDHPGFSLRGISRAFFANLRSGNLQGGSTITQQLVKNALLTPEKTLVRKVKEIILSVRVEMTFSKDEILEMYLNEVSFGGTSYGIEEASREYFGRDVEGLNLAEAAFLAGLPKSPTKFSPYGSSPSLAFERQREVLRLMRINRFITTQQEEEAANTRIVLISPTSEIKAPHFVMYVRQLLVDEFGEEMVEKGGLEVTTTLDLSIQELAEKVVKEEVDRLKSVHVTNGASVVVNPKNGEILAMVGSKDYFDANNDGNVNVVLANRQPGSSIKVVNYAYALSHGFNPSSLLDDSPVAFAVPGQPLYTPKNYDGQFKGRVTVRTALAESRNIPAVKVLANYGVGKMIELGQKMGITTWDETSRFGLSLTLGGGEVKLIELAQVYAALANEGKRVKATPIIQIKDYKGREIWKDNFDLSQEVVDPRVAYMLIDILKDNLARSGEFGLSSYLVIKNHPEVAVKTGTSNDLRDNLTVGFNQEYLTAVWVGNNDNSPMSRIASGVTGASPIWNKIMSTLLNDKVSTDWKPPEGLIRAFDCLAGKEDWFLEENRPTKPCSQITPPPTIIPGPQVLGTEDRQEE
jgi:1A family penicillin-binding protein